MQKCLPPSGRCPVCDINPGRQALGTSGFTGRPRCQVPLCHWQGCKRAAHRPVVAVNPVAGRHWPVRSAAGGPERLALKSRSLPDRLRIFFPLPPQTSQDRRIYFSRLPASSITQTLSVELGASSPLHSFFSKGSLTRSQDVGQAAGEGPGHAGKF